MRFDSSIKLHLACAKDELYLEMNYIYFDAGFAIASDSYILARVKLSEISDMSEDEIDSLQSKFIYKDDWRDLIRQKNLIVCEDGFKYGNRKILFANPEREYPNYNGVCPDPDELSSQEYVGINADLLKILSDCLPKGESQMKLSFHGGDRAITVTKKGIESWGIIMPCAIDF